MVQSQRQGTCHFEEAGEKCVIRTRYNMSSLCYDHDHDHDHTKDHGEQGHARKSDMRVEC